MVGDGLVYVRVEPPDLTARLTGQESHVRLREGLSDGTESRAHKQYIAEVVQPHEQDASQGLGLYVSEHGTNAPVQSRILVDGFATSSVSFSAALIRFIVAEAERPGRSGRTTTSPPSSLTTDSSTRRSPAWSPPLTCRSGLIRRIRGSGVSPSKTTTWSTHGSASSSSTRSSSGVTGRPAPFTRRAEASEFTPTTSMSPSLLASCSRKRCPRCSRSKHPFVKTTFPPECRTR